MAFGIYLLGYAILIVGLAIGAYLLHVPSKWIGVGVICLIGIGIARGVRGTREKDPASRP
jgi:cadmium resistance protein CadD (predicted permease)